MFIGDRVIAIDGRSTKGASRDEVLDLIINAPRPVTIYFQHDSQQDLELQYQRTMATQRLQHPAVSKAWVPPFRRVKLPPPTAKLARSEMDGLVPAPAPAPTEPGGRPIQMQVNDFFKFAGDGLNAAGRNTGDFFKDLGENTVKIGENTVKTIADLPSNTVKTITSLSPLDTEPLQPTRTGAAKATEVPENATAGDAEKDAAPAAVACSYFYGDPSGQVQGPFPTATLAVWIAHGALPADTPVCLEGADEFVPLAEAPALARWLPGDEPAAKEGAIEAVAPGDDPAPVETEPPHPTPQPTPPMEPTPAPEENWAVSVTRTAAAAGAAIQASLSFPRGSKPAPELAPAHAPPPELETGPEPAPEPEPKVTPKLASL